METIKKEVTVTVEIEMEQDDILSAACNMCLGVDGYIDSYCFDGDEVVEWALDNRRDELTDALEEELKDAFREEILAEAKGNLGELREAVSNLTEERDGFKEQLNASAHRFNDLRDERDNLAKTARQLTEERDRLGNRNVMLCTQFDEEHGKSKALINGFKEQLNAYAAVNKELKVEVDAAVKREAYLEAKHDDLNERFLALCEMLNAVSKGLEAHTHSIGVLELDLNTALDEAAKKFQSKTNNEGGE